MQCLCQHQSHQSASKLKGTSRRTAVAAAPRPLRLRAAPPLPLHPAFAPWPAPPLLHRATLPAAGRPSQQHATSDAPGDALERVEALRQELDSLESELRQASEAGELCARRSRRLRERSQQLSEYALEHVAQGDEEAARSALRIKASVRSALDAATARAAANAALAAKLEQVVEERQLALLVAIREARAAIEAAKGAQSEADEQRRELRRASSSGRLRSLDD